MTNLAKLTIAALTVGTTLAAHAMIPSTNIVQNINFRLTLIEQGSTNHPSANLTVVTLDRARVTTRDIIAALGTATTNDFSANARLVRVKHVLTDGEFTSYQVRDHTNAPVDVTSFFSGTFTESPIRAYKYNSATGINTGLNYGVLHLVLTNTPPFNLTGSLDLAGGAVTEHASIKTGNVVLGVDDVTAAVAGTGIDTNGIAGILTGTITITGRIVERQ